MTGSLVVRDLRAAWERRRLIDAIDSRLRMQAAATSRRDLREWVDGQTIRVARVVGDELRMETIVIPPVVMPCINTKVSVKP